MASSEKPIQFGIRHLLAAMFAVALLAALIAPWVRGWGAGQWLGLVAQTGLALATFVLGGMICVSLRRACTARVGQVRFRVLVRIEGSDRWNPVNAYVLIGMATIMLVLIAGSSIVTEGRPNQLLFYGAFVGVFGAVGLTQLWVPPNKAVVGDRGVAVAGCFFSWSQLLWAIQPGRMPVLLLKTPGWSFELFPDAETDKPLAAFLQGRTRPWDEVVPAQEKR